MDTNEVDPEPAAAPPVTIETKTEVSPQLPAGALRPGLLQSSWRGAKLGFRWTTYVAGPMAVLLMSLPLVLSVFGLGSGRGWVFLPGWRVFLLLPGPFNFFFGCGFCGSFVGAVVGLINALIRRILPEARLAAWRKVAHRPIRLLRWRRNSVVPIETTLSRSRRHHWVRLIGALVLVILAAALGMGAYVGRFVDQRLAAAISAADRDDPFWRLADLMAHRDPVPDAENSARVVAEALTRLPENWPANPPPDSGEPKAPLTEVYDRLSVTADNVRLNDADANTLRHELETYDEGVRIARTVADYDRGRHELEFGPTLIDTPLEETQAARTVARLLAADSAIRAHDGDLDGALDSCRAILGVGRSIGDEPFMISQIVRVAIGRVSLKFTHRALGQGEPSDTALARLQSLLLDDLTQPLLLYGLKGERAVMAEMIRRIGAGELPINAISTGAPPFDPDSPRPVISSWGKLLYDNQRAVALVWLNQAVAIARRPAAEQPPLWVAWQAEIDRVRRTWHAPFTATLPVLMTPALSAAAPAHLMYKAEQGATVILLAAERHRKKTGSWPTSIAAIDPGILPNPPVDPYSGQAYGMEHRDGQLFVYSIGPNHKNEHGAFDRKRWMNGKTDDVGAVAWDIPWRRQPAPPVEAPPMAEGEPAER